MQGGWEMGEVTITGGVKETVPVTAAVSLYYPLEKGETPEIKFNMPLMMKAPLRGGLCRTCGILVGRNRDRIMSACVCRFCRPDADAHGADSQRCAGPVRLITPFCAAANIATGRVNYTRPKSNAARGYDSMRREHNAGPASENRIQRGSMFPPRRRNNDPCRKDHGKRCSGQDRKPRRSPIRSNRIRR
jgi:hypothetical protein